MIDFKGPDIRLEAIREIISLQLPIWFYGHGLYSQTLTDYFRANGVSASINYFVDDQYYKNDGAIRMSEFLESYTDSAVVVIAVYDYDVVKRFKEQFSGIISHIYDFHMTSMALHTLSWNRQEAENNIEGYQRTYEMLSDDASKRTMKLYLRAAVNGEFDALYANCHIPVAYFNHITKGLTVDTLIDCGAFDGDSIHDFVRVFPDYRNIYAIEPDPMNREHLSERVVNECISDVMVIPNGVYKESGVLHFSSDGTSAAHVSDEDGEMELQVIAIDDLVSKSCHEGERLLIKMDIEGSEMDALQGAENTIKTYHPCLTVCVYHKERDLIDIPAYIDSIAGSGKYDYKLGFHGKELAELVFYAIPRNL